MSLDRLASLAGSVHLGSMIVLILIDVLVPTTQAIHQRNTTHLFDNPKALFISGPGNNNNNNNKTWTRFRRLKQYDQVEINRCDKSTFEYCLSKMQDVMQNSSLAFPTNIDDLELTCRKLKDGDYCAERYIRSCASDRQRGIYQDIVQGTKNVIRLLCQHGSAQQEYLRYAACFKEIFMGTCSLQFARFQEVLGLMGTAAENNNNSSSSSSSGTQSWIKDEQHLQQFCCAYRDNVDCQYRNVQKFCGENGHDFYRRYTNMMTDSLINEHCIGYTYSHKCASFDQADDDNLNATLGGHDARQLQSKNKTHWQNRKEHHRPAAAAADNGQLRINESSQLSSRGHSLHSVTFSLLLIGFLYLF